MRTLEFYLCSLYTWELNFGQTTWDKTHVLWGTSWGMHLGTWEHDGNTLEIFSNEFVVENVNFFAIVQILHQNNMAGNALEC
jgi:hypothetical protein